MTATITLRLNNIPAADIQDDTGYPTPPGLLLQQCHEYLVYTPDTSASSVQLKQQQLIIRGGPSSFVGSDGSFGTVTANAKNEPYVRNFDYSGFHNGPGIVVFSGTEAQVSQVWSQMEADAASLSSLQVPYYALGPNSNSFASTILNDAHALNPKVSGQPSYIDDVLAPGESINLRQVSVNPISNNTAIERFLAAIADDAFTFDPEVLLLINEYLSQAQSAGLNSKQVASDVDSAYVAKVAYDEGSAALESVSEGAGPNGSSAYTFTQGGVTSKATFDSSANLLTYTSTNSSGVKYTEAFNTNGTLHSDTFNNTDGTSTVATFDQDTNFDFTPIDVSIATYSGANATGTLREVNTENGSTSVITTYSGNIATTTDADSNETAYNYDAALADSQGSPVSYNTIASQLGMAGITGGLLAATNGGTSASATPQQAEVQLPVAVGTTQAITGSSFNTNGLSGDAASNASWILNVATGSYTPVGFLEGQNGAAGLYYVVNGAGAVLDSYNPADLGTFAATYGSNTLTINTRHGNTIEFSATGAVTIENNDGTISSSGALLYEPQTYALDAGGSVTGLGTGSDIASLNSSSATPDGTWAISASSATTAAFTGGTGSGFSGTASLTGIGEVQLGGALYGLQIADGGALTAGFSDPANDIVAETAAGGNSLYFNGQGTTWWHEVASGGDTALLQQRVTEMYMPDVAADYSYQYYNYGLLILTDTVSNAQTVFQGQGGTGEIVFADVANDNLGGQTHAA